MSRTRTTTSSLNASAVSQMEPPVGVNFAALLRRLPAICARRAPSASRYTGRGGNDTVT